MTVQPASRIVDPATPATSTMRFGLCTTSTIIPRTWWWLTGANRFTHVAWLSNWLGTKTISCMTKSNLLSNIVLKICLLYLTVLLIHTYSFDLYRHELYTDIRITVSIKPYTHIHYVNYVSTTRCYADNLCAVLFWFPSLRRLLCSASFFASGDWKLETAWFVVSMIVLLFKAPFVMWSKHIGYGGSVIPALNICAVGPLINWDFQSLHSHGEVSSFHTSQFLSVSFHWLLVLDDLLLTAYPYD